MKHLLILLISAFSMFIFTACNDDTKTETTVNNYGDEICDINTSYEFKINLDENTTAFLYPTSLVVDCYLNTCEKYLDIILDYEDNITDDSNETLDDNTTL